MLEAPLQRLDTARAERQVDSPVVVAAGALGGAAKVENAVRSRKLLCIYFLVPVHEEWAFELKEALLEPLPPTELRHPRRSLGLLFNKISGDFLYLLGPRSIASARSLQFGLAL